MLYSRVYCNCNGILLVTIVTFCALSFLIIMIIATV